MRSKLSRWRDEIDDTCNPPVAFHRRSPGICLMRGDEILCQAYAPWWGRGVTEIGAVTAEAHRRKGYAKMTCGYLARDCEALGFTTHWTCHASNAGSVKVAQALGFRSERPYELIEYTKTD